MCVPYFLNTLHSGEMSQNAGGQVLAMSRLLPWWNFRANKDKSGGEAAPGHASAAKASDTDEAEPADTQRPPRSGVA
jgi:hypothetical protein